MFIEIEQIQNETDLDETLFTHEAAIEDLNDTYARLSLSIRELTMYQLSQAQPLGLLCGV